ncbi:MarR family transcriptional regulator [Actinomadura craniellae]|uniref:MarR family transcriptional regulator n=1 Tax=Actinomadura craniellae TaxID=2231787 RepID=A0A365H121_9ACTN|nr:MarR family transcriptional regulator [Actinomadura craniellae]RAY12771.1 MarR family transcriptional regulator [Actinomadura craniellae]
MHQPAPPIAYLLACASTLAARRADEKLRPHGLTIRQFGLLHQLRLEPELTMSELAQQLGIARQSVHQLINELEQAGHLRRLPGASYRTRRLEVTDTAQYLLSRMSGALDGAETGLLGGLDPDEVETLRLLLRRLLAHATDDETWMSDG